jgi:voltage-gated potassium channel
MVAPDPTPLDAAPVGPNPSRHTPWRRWRRALRELYHGHGEGAQRFRLAIIALDVAIIGFFIASPMIRDAPWFLIVDYMVAALLVADLTARAVAWGNVWGWLRRPIVWVDLVVLASLLAPALLANFGFLRVLRLWTLLNSEFFWRTIGAGKWQNTRTEDLGRGLSHIIVYVFLTTGLVFALYAGKAPGLNHYIDALYFTVTTFTTTGFGDITLPGAGGRLLAIVIMITGITLFVRLAGALMQPDRVVYDCHGCALSRHDRDAVHCKACGTRLQIPNAH